MAENTRKRKSKWDVIADTHVPSEIRQDDVPPEKEDDSLKDKESNSDWNSFPRSDINQFSKWSDMKTILPKENSEYDRSSKLSELEDENIRESMECSRMPQSPKCSGMEAGDTDGSKSSYWGPMPGQTTGKDGDVPESLEHPDVEDGDRVGSKSLGWEPISGNQTTAKGGSVRRESDGWGTTLDQKYNSSMSPGLNARRQHSPSISSRSGRSWSRRSRSRSRSRSPSRGLKHKSERWVDRGRAGGGSAASCRYEDGGRRHLDRSTADMKESRYQRERYSGHDNQGNSTDSWEQRDYTRDRPARRHESCYDDERERPEKYTERCFDFTKGRCYRGLSCRFIHHDPFIDGGRNMKDEARERLRDRRDSDASFGRRVESRRVSVAPCKYFAEGRCRRGEDCKFSHQGVPHGQPEGTDYSSLRGGPSWVDQTVPMDATDSTPWVDQTAAQSKGPEDSTGAKPQHQEGEMLVHEEMNSANNQLRVAAAVPGQNFSQNGQSQRMVLQPLHAHSLSPNVPPLAFNGQMQQIYSLPPNVMGQFIPPQVPSNPLDFNLILQSRPVLPPPSNGQSQQNFYPSGQIQQNLPVLHIAPNQQNLSLSGQIQNLSAPHNAASQLIPNLLPPHIGQSQPIFQLSEQIQQSQQNIGISGHSQQIPPPQVEQMQQIVHSVAPNGQNQFSAAQPPPNPQNFNSDEQNHMMNSQIQSNLHHPTQISVDELTQGASMSPIAQKVVTSDQAAQITNLSASLAQFFGNGPQLPQLYATLNPHVATGLEPSQPFSNPGATRPLTPAAAPTLDPISDGTEPEQSDDGDAPPGFSSIPVKQEDPKLSESQTSPRSSAPVSTANETNDSNQGNQEPNPVEMSGDTASKEVDGTETGQNKKDRTARSEDANADVRTDGESKRSKEAKGLRMFKCALVEFVKSYLKPAWKEGHLSKEVHKTIVKKVVDKVTGAMQAANVPQTQEKIDVYLAYSKEKLNKLVQAYLEKYV